MISRSAKRKLDAQNSRSTRSVKVKETRSSCNSPPYDKNAAKKRSSASKNTNTRSQNGASVTKSQEKQQKVKKTVKTKPRCSGRNVNNNNTAKTNNRNANESPKRSNLVNSTLSNKRKLSESAENIVKKRLKVSNVKRNKELESLMKNDISLVNNPIFATSTTSRTTRNSAKIKSTAKIESVSKTNQLETSIRRSSRNNNGNNIDNASPQNKNMAKMDYRKTATNKENITKKQPSISNFQESKKNESICRAPVILLRKYQPNAESSKKKSLPISKLRKREFHNYAELSLDNSNVADKSNKNAEHVPIYKQVINESVQNKKKVEDLYEFDFSEDSCESFAEKPKAKKRKRIRKIMPKKAKTNIIEKPKKKLIVKIKDAKNTSGSYNKKINGVLENLKNNIRNRSRSQDEINQDLSNDQDFDNIDHDYENDDPYFGFDKLEDNQTENNNRIIILNNTVIKSGNNNQTMVTPAKIKRPNANSTMIGNKVLTPWRFNEINIRRNPHFIQIKPSALPNIDQDMVLDHTIVDRLDQSLKHSKTPSRISEATCKMSPVQTTLNEYFEGTFNFDSNKENINLNKSSLFDDHIFSPIKKHNSSRNPIDKAKRKILCEKSDNVMKISTPRRENEESVQNDENFGFTSDEEIEVADRGENKAKFERPFRVSINANDKKYQGKVKHIEKAVSIASSDDEDDNRSDLSDDNDENEGKAYRLFEDFDDTPDRLDIKDINVKTRKHRTKQLNDSNGVRPRRRKDMRTKEEEEAAEKWAQEFNKMCEEVEQFPLEIE